MIFPFRKPRPALQPVPPAWLDILRDNFFLWRQMPETDRARLLERMQRFIAAKNWEGCAGQEITDEVKVTIASQACLLLLGIEDYCFDEMRTILVYPGGFLRVLEDSLGEKDELEYVLGEAYQDGPVILSWWDALWDGRRRGSKNLVMHEFAHKLAELGNSETGRPPLVAEAQAAHWDRVITEERERLAADADYERPTLLDPYGAEDRNEFFAVATETFFLHPHALKQRHPELFDLFVHCYRQDPTAWPLEAEDSTQAQETEIEYTRHSLAECNAHLARQPDAADVLAARAELHSELEEYDRAIEDWSAVLAQATDAEEKASALYERGEVHARADHHEAALDDFSEALRLTPDFARAWCSRGVLRAEREDWRGALKDLNEALSLDPRDDAALIERGLVYLDLDKPRKALRDLDKAARLSPWDAAIYRHRAEAHAALGNQREAEEDKARAAELDKDKDDKSRLP